MEYRFDRYRDGRRMAEGLVLTKPKTVDDAVAVACRLAEAGDVLVLREDHARLAAVEAERDAARAGEARAVEALRRYRSAQRRMLDKWSECNFEERQILWRSLYACEAFADEVLDAKTPALD